MSIDFDEQIDPRDGRLSSRRKESKNSIPEMRSQVFKINQKTDHGEIQRELQIIHMKIVRKEWPRHGYCAE